MPREDRPTRAGDSGPTAPSPDYAACTGGRIYLRQEILALALLGKAPWMLNGAKKAATTFIAESIRDPELRDRVTPDYEFGCKRVLLSDDWYPTLERPDVELVHRRSGRAAETGASTCAHGAATERRHRASGRSIGSRMRLAASRITRGAECATRRTKLATCLARALRTGLRFVPRGRTCTALLHRGGEELADVPHLSLIRT